MTSTLPYDRRGSYSILHNHLRSYEQARLQKLANGKGNESARAAMRLANLNLEADAARRVQHDSDATLVNAPASNVAELSYDSDTEGEEDAKPQGDIATHDTAMGGTASMAATIVVEKQLAAGKKEKKDKPGGRRKSLKETLNKAAFTAFSGSVPKRRGPEFAIYPI